MCQGYPAANVARAISRHCQPLYCTKWVMWVKGGPRWATCTHIHTDAHTHTVNNGEPEWKVKWLVELSGLSLGWKEWGETHTHTRWGSDGFLMLTVVVSSNRKWGGQVWVTVVSLCLDRTQLWLVCVSMKVMKQYISYFLPLPTPTHTITHTHAVLFCFLSVIPLRWPRIESN